MRLTTCDALIRKYRDEMPLWAFLEVVSFGTFVGLVKFCADRWGDDALLVRHYLLKKGKSIRNASAHSLCILNDLQEYDIPTERVSPVVSKAIAECGVSKRLRSEKLRSPRMVQVATLLYLYGVAAPSGASRSQRSSITLTRTPACWTNQARRYPPSGSSGA